MPIYEYECRGCGNRFERLVLKQEEAPTCPSCGNAEVERLLSLPRVQGDGSRERALKAAQRRNAAQGRDRMHERIEYESSHDD